MSLADLSNLPPAELDRVRAAGAIGLPRDRSVALLRHDDVTDALGNPELVARHRFRTTIRLYGGSTVIDSDGPDHRRQRKPLVRGLMDSMEVFLDTGAIDTIAAKAVADLRSLPAPELVRNLAVRVVTEAMARMTGLLPEESLHLYTLHRPVVRFLAGDPAAFAAARANLEDVLDIYARRRPEGTERAAPMARALDEALFDNSLSEPEFSRNRILLFMGGTETTVCAISNVIWLLATDKSLLGRLRKSSHEELKAAVAEILRVQPPMFSITKFAARPLEFSGVPVETGAAIHLCLAAACWDPDRFPEPRSVKLMRSASTNLMFGHGVHFCPGAALAGLEIMAVLRALIREVRAIRLLGDPPPSISGTMFRTPGTLRAAFDWAAR